MHNNQNQKKSVYIQSMRENPWANPRSVTDFNKTLETQHVSLVYTLYLTSINVCNEYSKDIFISKASVTATFPYRVWRQKLQFFSHF